MRLIPAPGLPRPSYRDVVVDEASRAVTLQRPLLLDLGAVAKGLAVDAAARELASFKNFVVDAGGDLYAAGQNPSGEPWSIGIRHPRDSANVIETLRASDFAVCTSGDYDAKSRTADGGHHILDPRGNSLRTTGGPAGLAAAAEAARRSRRTTAAGGPGDPMPSATQLASVTVIASSAMVADALGTAAFVLGPIAGIELLERHDVRGIMYTPQLERFETNA